MKKREATYDNILKLTLEATETLSEGIPAKIKPLMKVIIYFGILLFFILSVPILKISRLIRKKPNAFENLQMELETKWHSESSTNALIVLRKIYAELKEKSDELHFKGVYIAPYGNFKFMEYLSVLELLYHYEMRHKSWLLAIEVCDALINPLLDRKDKMRGALDKWIVYKAKAIYQSKGNAAAQEYLLRHMDHKSDKSSVNTYLYELRDVSKKR